MNRPQAIPALDPLYADIRRRDPIRPAILLDVRERDEFMPSGSRARSSSPCPSWACASRTSRKDRPVMVIAPRAPGP